MRNHTVTISAVSITFFFIKREHLDISAIDYFTVNSFHRNPLQLPELPFGQLVILFFVSNALVSNFALNSILENSTLPIRRLVRIHYFHAYRFNVFFSRKVISCVGNILTVLVAGFCFKYVMIFRLSEFGLFILLIHLSLIDSYKYAWLLFCGHSLWKR